MWNTAQPRRDFSLWCIKSQGSHFTPICPVLLKTFKSKWDAPSQSREGSKPHVLPVLSTPADWGSSWLWFCWRWSPATPWMFRMGDWSSWRLNATRFFLYQDHCRWICHGVVGERGSRTQMQTRMEARRVNLKDLLNKGKNQQSQQCWREPIN